MSAMKFNKEIISKSEKTTFQKFLSEQAFWVTVALFGICFVMYFVEDAFSSKDNIFNITRNFSFRDYGYWHDLCNNNSWY